MGEFSDKVFEVVARIPRGRVATYGQVARLMGSPRSARYVGFALRTNATPVEMPCHRVVFADGGICPGYAFGGPDVQRKLLEEEGIAFVDETHVDLDAFKWDPAMNAAATDSDEDDGLEQRPTDVDWEAEIGRW